MDKSRNNKIYEFEDFCLDAAHLLLYRNERQISLAPKVVETLLALVERHGEVLSKDELMEIVWADSIVEESNLSQNLYLLRRILNETAGGKPLIETLRRRGYRFNGNVSRVEAKQAEDFPPYKNQSAARKISTGGHRFGVERRGNVPALAGWKTTERNEKSESGNIDFLPQASEPANAFQACQLSRVHYHQIAIPHLIKSRELLEQAVRLDAGYAPAYAALAEQCVTEAIMGLRAPAESFAEAKDAIRRAFDLNANSAEFYAAAGYVDLVCDWNFTEAERNLRKSLELNSHCAFANNYLGQVFMFRRRFDEAETYLRRARQIEPMGLYNRVVLAITYFLTRNYQKASEESEKTLAVFPQFLVAAQMRCWILEQTGRDSEAVAEYEKILKKPDGEFARRWIGCAYARAGEREKARETAALLVAESREHYLSPIHLAMLYAGLDEPDEATFYLEKARDERDPWLLWIAADPRFDNLRSDSRFQKLEKLVFSESAPPAPKRLEKIENQTRIVAGENNNGKIQTINGKPFSAANEHQNDLSIAVLPFVNMSADAENEYFCDGLAEELLNALAKIKDLKVAARTSAFSFKNRNIDVGEIGNVLNVKTIIEGSVRKAGNRLRISVQLINASNGYHIWSERYDGEINDIFDLQDEITLAVIGELKVKFLSEEKAALRRRRAENVEAYRLYLKGRYHILKLRPAEIQTGISYFEQAIALDPNYALAYVGIANAHQILPLAIELAPSEHFPKAKAAAHRAIEIDDELAEAHSVLGWITFWFDWDWKFAEKECRRAFELNPNGADAYEAYAHVLSNTGRHAEALAAIKRAREIDPLHLRINALEGQFLLHAGKIEEASEKLRKAIELEPRFWLAHLFTASVYIEKKMFAEAIESARKARQFSGSARIRLLSALTLWLNRASEPKRARCSKNC